MRLRRFVRVTLRWVVRAAVFVVATLALAEIGLRFLSLFAHDRATAWRPQARYRVLCVGDSHTYGFMVPRDETYPAYLQEFLDAQAAGAYSVINLGIPGMNTAQVRNRLPSEIASYHPDTIVVCCGANNTWNQAEVATDSSPALSLARLLNASRVYRFVRVGLHDLRLARDLRTVERDLHSTISGQISREPEDSVADPWSLNATHTIRHWDGTVDEVRHQKGEDASEAIAEEQAVRDFTAMAESARAAGIKLVFVEYPTNLAAFAFANRAMRRVGAQYGTAVVASNAALQRVAPEDRKWLPAAHPSGAIYREIARDVAAAVTR